MNPNTMRKMDYLLGRPICFSLTLWYKLQRIFGFKNPGYDSPPKNALFIELAEMGSTVFANPAIKKFKNCYPKSGVYFLLFDNIKESMELLKHVPKENVITIDAGNIFTLAFDTVKFMLVSRRHKIDTAINLETFARYSTILGYLSGARKMVGFHRFHQEGLYIGNFLTHKVAYNPHIHTAYSFIALVEALKADKNEIPFVKLPVAEERLEIPKIKSSDERRNKIWNLLKKTNPDISSKNKLIIVNPNASKLISIRKWPLSHYAELVRKLLQDKNVFVAITGVQSEKQDAQFICKKVNNSRVLDLTGKTSLLELIDLFNVAEMFITNDSGPAHFASMTDVHIVVFFGPETPKLYAPLTDNLTVMYSSFYCSPCVSAFNQRLSPCNNNLCLKTISPEMVYWKIKSVLYKK